MLKASFLASTLAQAKSSVLAIKKDSPRMTKLSTQLLSKNRYWTFSILLPFIIGCAGSKPNLQTDPHAFSPEQVIQKIGENRAKVKTLAGSGKIIVNIPAQKFTGDLTVRVQRPDSLFIKTEAILGVDVGFLFADGVNFSSYSPIDNHHFSGPVDRIDGLVLFQMEIDYPELLNSVIGVPYFPTSSDTKMSARGGKLVFEQKLRDQNLRYEVDAQKFVITRIELSNDAGEMFFRQTFKRFRKVRGVWLPRHIVLTRPQNREQLTVWYSAVKPNTPIRPKDFQYKVPDNAESVILGKNKSGE